MTHPAPHPEPSSGAGPADADPWLLAEPRLPPVARVVFARGARRRLLAIGVAAGLTALAVGWRATRTPTYVASLTLRMEESELQDARVAPRPPSRIREHVLTVALSRERLLALMERHHLNDRLRAVNPVAAVQGFRDDLSVEVIRNYFLLDRESGAQPRTARVVVQYSGGDREQVRAVVHELGQVILETQAESRAARLALARETNAAQAARAREQLRSLELRRARLLAEELGAGGRVPAVHAELVAVQRDIGRLVARVEDLDRRGTDLELARDAERSNLGLTFRLVDEGMQTLRPPLPAAGLAAVAIAVLAFLAPVATVVIGAFDRRLYLAADVVACGYPLLGAVPFAPGDDAGSLAARRRTATGRPSR